MNGPDDFIATRGGEEFLELLDQAKEFTKSITLSPGESPAAVDAAEEVLCEHAKRLGIFQRGKEVVQVITLGENQCSVALHREPGTVMLRSVEVVALTEIWDRLITW